MEDVRTRTLALIERSRWQIGDATANAFAYCARDAGNLTELDVLLEMLRERLV